MARNKKPHGKAYKGRTVGVPVMQELQWEFMAASHGSLAALRLAPSGEAFDQLAAVFNVIYVALHDKGITNPALQSGMQALIDVAEREERLGKIELGQYDVQPLELAVLECEQLVKRLDIMSLYFAQKKLRLIAAAEAAAKVNFQPAAQLQEEAA